MKSKKMLIGLLISIAFNVGFVVIFAYHVCMKPKPVMPRPPQVHERSQKFFRDENVTQLRRGNIELRREFFQELAKPEIDKERLGELIQKLEESQRTLEHSVLLHFIQIREEMTAEEAEEFFGKFHERHRRFRVRQET